ncbi:hypothetical protein C8R43DRAFT_958691 [Mycena crocata]|nr:hypothetical protein C8R43DRAFT_958691 [Mycena crocata]
MYEDVEHRMQCKTSHQPKGTKSTHDYCPGNDEEVAKDQEPQEDEEMGEDDSEIPTREVVEHVVTKKTRKNQKIHTGNCTGREEIGKDHFRIRQGSGCKFRDIKLQQFTVSVAGGKLSSGDAEDVDAEIDVAAEDELGTGKRKRRPNQQYPIVMLDEPEEGETSASVVEGRSKVLSSPDHIKLGKYSVRRPRRKAPRRKKWIFGLFFADFVTVLKIPSVTSDRFEYIRKFLGL